MFDPEELEEQLRLMGAGDTLACRKRLAGSSEHVQSVHTRRGLYDRAEVDWLGAAGAAGIAAPSPRRYAGAPGCSQQRTPVSTQERTRGTPRAREDLIVCRP